MKTFRQFITEMPVIQPDYNKEKYALNDPVPSHRDEHTKEISTTSSGHIITHRNVPGEVSHTFEAINPKTGLTQMKMSANKIGGILQEFKLAGRAGSDIKAHEFYHHLITHHNMELNSSEMHSKVWEKLSSMPGVTMTRKKYGQGLRPDKKTKMHTGDNWKKNYGDGDTYFVASKK